MFQSVLDLVPLRFTRSQGCDFRLAMHAMIQMIDHLLSLSLIQQIIKHLSKALFVALRISHFHYSVSNCLTRFLIFAMTRLLAV